MNTTLIDSYLQNLSQRQKDKLFEIMEYIQSVVENAVVANVFTLPGFTVDFLPICNMRVKHNKIIIRFFQKDVFESFGEKMADIDHGICSITIRDAEEIKTDVIKELLNLTAMSEKVDAAFTRSIQMRDYGYYDNRILTPKRESRKING